MDERLYKYINYNSDSALKLLDLTEQQVLEDPDFPSLFSGNDLFTGSDPSAHCYCGHQVMIIHFVSFCLFLLL